ncbi:hypothetical protein KP509_11G042100 [Ceratopteris richardii]|uniref:Pentatricopeptide repeat-containing protein n=1 Tax=Ceratopteris richardii TaxID=49495 RepID=A0A8T2TUU9_CERRI|nr:hypothetical protein KP509_11G042100 [Ceratopteris richardii]
MTCLNAEKLSLVSLLRNCAKSKELDEGARLHAHVLKQGLLGKCCAISSSLINMYAKCGALVKARDILHEIPIRDVFSWTALLTGYVDHGASEGAIACFEEMQIDGIHPNAVTFTCILKAYGNLGAVSQGEKIHDEIVRQGLLSDNVSLGTALVSMYTKCGVLMKARQVLDGLHVRNVITWNVLIGGYAQQGQIKEVLKCFNEMQDEGISPDKVTFIFALKSCAAVGAVNDGERIHNDVIKLGILWNNADLGNALLDMYAKCGAFEKANRILEELSFQDVVSWNALITGYIQQNQGYNALKCFESMQLKGISPNEVTFICILKVCGSIRAIEKGKAIHDEIVRQKLLMNNITLGSAVIDMYGKCGDLVRAQEVLNGLPARDVVCWNALIAGCTQEGQVEQVLSYFCCMQDEGCSPNATTFTCVLKACSRKGYIEKGEEIHKEIVRKELLTDNVVLGTALVQFYVKHGALVKARSVLEKLPVCDIVSWNALLTGYVQQGFGEEALNCLEKMQQKGFHPNEITWSCILKACGQTGALDKGEQLHDEIARQGTLERSTVVTNCLVDMYAKCGALEKAFRLLEELAIGNVLSWSALIAGYAQQGRGKEALICFEVMQQRGFSPDSITFSIILNACTHSGLIEEGQTLFDLMRAKFGIEAELEHFLCMIKLFGHAGQFEKIVKLIERMPCSANFAVWSALLDACKVWGDVRVGKWAFEHALQLDRIDGTAYTCTTI